MFNSFLVFNCREMDFSKNTLTCPMCDGTMELKDSSENHIEETPHWIRVCEDCPAVLFEYRDSYNIDKLRECLEKS